MVLFRGHCKKGAPVGCVRFQGLVREKGGEDGQSNHIRKTGVVCL